MIDSKRKAFIFLTLAFILAIVTAFIVVNEIQNAQRALSETTAVPVAAEDIPTYSEISEDMIDWIDVPNSEGFTEMALTADQVIQSVAIVNMSEGDLFTENILRSQVDIPQDHRIVWLNSTDNVVQDQPVAEGDTVDIIITDDRDDGPVTLRVFDDISVVQRVEMEEEPDQIKISMPLEDAQSFIHYQHTADYIRVLLANQVQQPSLGDPNPELEEEEIDEEALEEAEPEEDEDTDDESEDEDEEEEDNDEDSEEDDDE